MGGWFLIRLVLRRFLFGLVTLLVVSVVVFGGTEILPGDVAEAVLGQGATPEAVAAVRTELNLDRPAYVRYFDWLGHLATLDLGNSLVSGVPVSQILAPRLPKTLLLGGIAALIAVPLAVGTGILAAMRPGGLFDRGATAGSIASISSPEFLVSTILVLVFAVQLRWVPAIVRIPDGAAFQAYATALFLPVSTLVIAAFAPIMRMTRSALLNVMSQPSIEMAILKGVPRRRIIVRHALPNAVAPIVNVVAVNLAYIIGGVVVVEQIFSFPGVANLMVDGVSSRDIPLVQVCAMFFCGLYVLLNLMADLISILANPRLRHPR
ncbi:ABC transporter permease [Mesorhizobium sp.]|uniref:ABC transporter permease n=1 Tax=Mesorhizobium sp. TaxID=1871066 RepID=UPI000FE4D100|nr:ABC transporter permease [Mesorhizobium sp.]RWB66308.1 MAG: ABC transporter permease [Mesorhizobium sp.]